MASKQFPKEELQSLVWDDSPTLEKIEERITDVSRWSVNYDMVFQEGDKFYSTSYSVGATEYQDESPYEYEDNLIDCDEVVPVEVTTIVYKPIN